MIGDLLGILSLFILGALGIWWVRTEKEAAQRAHERDERDLAYALKKAEEIMALHRNLDAMAHFIDAGYGATAGKDVPWATNLPRLSTCLITRVEFNEREYSVPVPVDNLLQGMRLVLTEAEAAGNHYAIALAQLPWARVRVRPFEHGPSFARCLVAHRPVKDGAVLRLDKDCKIMAIEPLVNCDQDGEDYRSWKQH